MLADMVFSQVESFTRPRISDAVAQQVQQRIGDGLLLPGRKLPSERELAEQLGVSRPSVREALRRLEADGFITAGARGGFVVADISERIVSLPLADLLDQNAQARADVLELRQGLESMATMYAAQRATPEDRGRISEAFRELEAAQAIPNVDRLARADAEFHLAIADACHNVALTHVMHGLHGPISRSLTLSHRLVDAVPAVERELHLQHQAIYDAILAQDPVRASAAAHAHLSYVQSLYRRETQAQGDEAPMMQLPCVSPPAGS